MRRATALCAAGIALSSLVAPSFVAPSFAAPRPAQTGYYLIRWDNTGVCQIWNTDLQQKPWSLFSEYKIVSKPVPTFTEAAAIQEKMRTSRACTI